MRSCTRRRRREWQAQARDWMQRQILPLLSRWLLQKHLESQNDLFEKLPYVEKPLATILTPPPEQADASLPSREARTQLLFSRHPWLCSRYLGERFVYLAYKLANRSPTFDRLARKHAVFPAPIALTLWPATARAVNPADLEASHGRGSAGLAGSLGMRRTARGQVHEVDRGQFRHPSPSRRFGVASMSPTMACPPSLTLTCWTVTRCSPPVRYLLSASTWVAKVRVNLLNACDALSCC
jgi:hypothetical protein